MIEPERIHLLSDQSTARPSGNRAAFVLYWMQAAQRAAENPALSWAAARADELGLPLVAAFIISDYPGATRAHYRWMLSGLAETARTLRDAGVGFVLRTGQPVSIISELARDAAMIVTDFSPVRWSLAARSSLARESGIPVHMVDGESVIPSRAASPKREWAARTFRLKVEGAIQHYADAAPLPVPVPRRSASGLTPDSIPFPDIPDAAMNPSRPKSGVQFNELYSGQRIDLPSGTNAALARLERFVKTGLDSYDRDRNEPLLDGTSALSPYLHFGQISPLAVLRTAKAHGGAGYPAFAEQLVVRRELARNFVLYSPDSYDRYEGLPAWAREALAASAGDRRHYLYTREQFERAGTHDPYWNAAQTQLVRTGTIHNYMRMYWGKMILAWSASPDEAFYTALYLNDTWALDGRDPNGYTGVAWCFGLHDRPWPARPVFGTIRSMTASGLKKKFDADAYARSWAPVQLP